MKHYPKTITRFSLLLVMHELFMYSHVQFLYILFYALYFALFLDFEQNKEIFQRKGIYSGEILNTTWRNFKIAGIDSSDGGSQKTSPMKSRASMDSISDIFPRNFR